MRELKKIFVNIFAIGTARVIEISAGLLSVSLIARYLGIEKYSEYVLIMTYVGTVVPLSFIGIERIVIREIAKKKEHANKYLAACFLIRWFLSFVVLILLTGIVFFANLSREMTVYIYVVGFAQLVMSSYMLYQSFFRALEQMKYETLFSSVFNGTLLASVLLVTFLDWGILSVFFGLLFANIARIGLTIAITRKRQIIPEIIMAEDLPLIKSLLKSSFILGISEVLIQVSLNINTIILRIFSKDTDISMYYASHYIIRYLCIFPLTLQVALMPILSRRASTLSASGVYQTSFKILAVLGLFFSVNFYIYSNYIIKLIYGKDFLAAAYSLKILSFPIALIFIIPLMEYLTVALNFEKYSMLFSGLLLLTNLIFGFILIPKLGFIGASIASSLGYFINFSAIFVFVSKKCSPAPLRHMIMPIIVSFFLGLFLFYIKIDGYEILFSLIGAVIYFSCIYVLKVFSHAEILVLKDTVRSITRRPRLKMES